MRNMGLATLMVFGFSAALWALGQETTRVTDELADKDVPRVSQEQPMSFWMDKKLEYSKSLLEHLTKADFEELEKEANQMRKLGRIEGFVRRRNEDYRVQLRTFEMATTELMRHARRRNIEGANLAFNQLTSSCVACHVLLREGVE